MTPSAEHDQRVERTPANDGQIDTAYLAAALARAGRPATVRHLVVERIEGGRVSRGVFSLRSDAGAFVLKRCGAERWRTELFGMTYNEPALWLCGATRALPAPLACPTFDVTYNAEQRECWMLMDDVSHGIAPRGSFSEAGARRLLEALARLHARYWERDDELSALPLLTLEQHVRVFTGPIAAIGGRVEATGWVEQVLNAVTLFRSYVPVLLDVLGSADADFYLDLCQHPQRWLRPLERAPQTMTHGDPRRANVALLASSVSLFDWDFACRAPAAADLAWYAFLHFWCYPPRDGRTPVERERLLLHYRQQLAAELGRRFDEAAFERAWQLSWLKVFVQLAFCLVDPLVDGTADPEEAARVRATCRAAVMRAKQILDTQGE